MNRNQRRFSNIFLNSRFQITYILYFLSFGLVSATVVIAIISYFQKQFFEQVIGVGDREISPTLFLNFSDVMEKMALSLSIFVVIYSVCGVVIAMFLSHRIVGPAYAIRRFIGDLKSGNYGGQVVLRHGDELRELESELNELSLLLKEKEKVNQK